MRQLYSLYLLRPHPTDYLEAVSQIYMGEQNNSVRENVYSGRQTWRETHSLTLSLRRKIKHKKEDDDEEDEEEDRKRDRERR